MADLNLANMTNPIFENLNPQQLEAVTAPDGPLLIVAGAGSGKTRVITRRIANLVIERGVRPFQIFGATFTNKAAAEMRRRIGELAGGIPPTDFHIATFHSLCARILRREAEAAGLTRSFTICDERDQISAVKQVMRDLGISEKQLKPADAHYAINQCKMRMLSPDDIGQVISSTIEELYMDVFRKYEEYLAANSAVDFEDLILKVVRLLQGNEEIRHSYQTRYKHVLVDEYQDTNAVQFELVRLLSEQHRNLTVVGDEDQSIYSWRGADITNLLEFQKYFPDATVVRLEQNYRSTGNILKAAAGVIANNTERLGKTLFTESGAGSPIYVLVARHEIEESIEVANAIEEFGSSGRYSYSDIAIFYRMGALSRIFEDRLRQRNIPYNVIGGIRFYDRAEIKDLLAYMQVIQNPHNAMALLRIINTPKRGLGDKSVQAIINYARANNVSEYTTLTRPEARERLPKAAARQVLNFIDMVKNWQEFSKENRLADLVKRILEDTNYIQEMGDPHSLDVRARTENLEELISAVTMFEREFKGATLEDYLENVTLFNSVEDPANREAVSLMTLHAAKGLEFKVVFLVGMDEQIFPSQRAMMERSLEEERRLFYVGITRARELLILTHSDSRMLYGEQRYLPASQFLKELPQDVLAPFGGKMGDDVGISRESYVQRSIAPGPSEGVATERPAVARGADSPIFNPKGLDLGQRVRHALLGDGIITGMSGNGSSLSLLVLFDDQKTHKLLARYANLQVLAEE